MKKLVTLLLAAGLVFSAANSASAVEVKASGTMDFAFQYSQNIYSGFQDYKDSARFTPNNEGTHQKHFGAVQRFRLGLDFIMSENLSAHYQAQVGTFTWGGPASGAISSGGNTNEALGGALGTRAANIVTRFAYLDWMIPNTDVKVRMGQQPVALPSFTFGSPVLDSSATGIVVSAPVNDNIGVTAMWLRALSDARRGTTSGTNLRRDDNFDVFGLIGDFKYDGFRVQPWAAVGVVGKDAGSTYVAANATTGVPAHWQWDSYGNGHKNGTAWMAGISAEVTMFDPFRLTGDFYYGALDASWHDATGLKHKEDNWGGWYAALGAEYKTVYGTPALKGWYASGDGKQNDHGTKAHKQAFAFWGDGAFNPTSTYFDGRYSIAETIDNSNPNGTWGISAQWNGISFVENLTHDLSVTYFQGTNHKTYIADPANGFLTSKDSAVEIDFNSTYNIYQNLATVLELGYIIQDFDGKNARRNFMGAAYDGDKVKYSDVWRAALNFRYTF